MSFGYVTATYCRPFHTCVWIFHYIRVFFFALSRTRYTRNISGFWILFLNSYSQKLRWEIPCRFFQLIPHKRTRALTSNDLFVVLSHYNWFPSSDQFISHVLSHHATFIYHGPVAPALNLLQTAVLYRACMHKSHIYKALQSSAPHVMQTRYNVRMMSLLRRWFTFIIVSVHALCSGPLHS